MDRPGRLTTLQVDIAGIFFALEAASGFLVAGGAALLASGLIDRPTEDLDLFAATPVESVAQARDAYVLALRSRGYGVVNIQDGPTFSRMVVTRDGDETLVDLAIDSPPHHRPTVTLLGPTLPPLELAGRKLLALFGRAEARDFADVYVLAQRYGKEVLLEQAQSLDTGFDLGVLAEMIGTIGRFDSGEIPLAPDSLVSARAFFADWANELGSSI